MTKADAKRAAELAMRDCILDAAANTQMVDAREGRRDPHEPRFYVEAGGAVYEVTIVQTRPPGWRKRR